MCGCVDTPHVWMCGHLTCVDTRHLWMCGHSTCVDTQLCNCCQVCRHERHVFAGSEEELSSSEESGKDWDQLEEEAKKGFVVL